MAFFISRSFLPPSMEIFDNHVHLKPETIDFFVSRFRAKGGTSLNLVNLTEECTNIDEFADKYRETISISQNLRERGLKVVTTIGPYPVNYISLRERMGKESAASLYTKAVDLAVEMILEGRANAIGEVGRPHFETSKDIVNESNEIIRYIFHATADNDIPVILHTESLDSAGMCELVQMARDAGKEKGVVKHFSQPIFSDNCGIVPSVPASRKNARMAPWGEKGFFLETDFAGDQGNPNFVLPPDSVPARVAMLLQEGVDPQKIWESMSFFESFYHLL